MEEGMKLVLNKEKCKVLSTCPEVAKAVARNVKARGYVCCRTCKQLGVGYAPGRRHAGVFQARLRE
eukprot:4681863-Karenia_brevis.AAC.1